MPADAAEIVRLAEKVRGRVMVAEDGCWNWPGAAHPKGYGQVWNNSERKIYATHRVMFLANGGTIPDGYHIDHLCRNPKCCNPAHLEAVTPQENARRGNAGLHYKLACEAITHCSNGHPYNPENTYTCKRGKRQCRACWPLNGKRARTRMKAAKEAQNAE